MLTRSAWIWFGVAMSERGESPVFVFGIGRTGTTLLARMLDRHPHLSIYLESGFLNARPSRGADAPPETDGEARARFDALLRQRMERHGKRRYGEKTPSHFTKVDTLRAWYPEARFVWLRRDPRDAWASFKHSTAHRAALRWTDRTLVGRSLYWNLYRDALRAAVRRHPTQMHEVDFAALVRDPERTLRIVCDFLGEPYDPSMLAIRENNSSFPETREAAGLRTEVLDRRVRLGRVETIAIELLCGEHMRALGLRLSAPSRWIVPPLSALGYYAAARRAHRWIRRRRSRHS